MLNNLVYNQSLDLAMLRLGRKNKNVRIPKTMGTYIDSLEAQLNELQLQLSLIVDQSSIERQKAEILANQIQAQIKLAEDKLLSFLNSYQKEIFNKVYSQVKVSEESLKFKGTNLYDLSFISNFDYSKVQLYNDRSLLEQRVDRRKVYLTEMRDNWNEVNFATGLIKRTDATIDAKMLPELYNQRNHFIREYYLSAIKFYQESTIIGFLHNPTNNLENLKQFISLNEENIPNLKKNLEYKRLSIGEAEYLNQKEQIDYSERMLITAKARLKYLMQAYEGTWTPPTFETLKEYATKNNMTYSRVVYELNEKTRQTLCVPDWIVSIAEMYNKIQKLEEPMTELNPYDSRWIRKAKEVINLESEGVSYTAQKLFKAIDEYWIALTMGISDLEDYYLDAIIAKAVAEDSSPVGSFVITNDYNLVDFTEDMNKLNASSTATPLQGYYVSNGMGGYNYAMGGFFSKVWKGVKSTVKSVVKVAQKVTGAVARATKSALDNTLGRVLPSSVYEKISNFTDAGLSIMSLHFDKKNFRGVVEGVMDFYLIAPRINAEMLRVAERHGVTKGLDKYSGGLITSYKNLNSTPIKLRKGEKIDWEMLAIDAIKVGLAVYAGASMVATQTTTNLVGEETGLNKTSLGQGFLSAGALIATGQSSLTQQLSSGATVAGTKAVVNNTSLGQSSLGRSVAEIGVSASVQSVQSNEAFSQIMRDKAEDKIKSVAKKTADKELLKATGTSLINTDLITSVSTDVYQFATGEKTIGELMEETKQHYANELTKIGDKLDSITQEKIDKEADKFLQKRINETYGIADKFGDQMAEYLMKKYGPKEEYDSVVTPDDYLNYQLYIPNGNDRIFNVVYKSNFALKAGLLLGVGVVFSSFLISDN